jgi:excisionase family DNA binding protein
VTAGTLGRGYSVRDMARLLRSGRERVTGMIRRGELPAVNVGTHARPRYVILPHQLEEFVNGRRAAETPAPARKRRRAAAIRDYYPD